MGRYSTAILADSPIHYWRMFENFGATSAQDIGSNMSYLWANSEFVPQTGTGLPELPGFGWTGIAADGGSANMRADGLGNFTPVVAGNTDPPGVAFPVPGTLECWYWVGVQSDVKVDVGWFVAGNPANQQLYGLLLAPGLITANGYGTAFVNFNFTGFITWHHAVLTTTTTTMALFVDGSSVGSTPVANSARGVLPFSLGQSTIQQAIGTKSGFVCEVALYNVVLSAGQIANHFAAAETPTFEPHYYGVRPDVVQQPIGYALGPAHTGLTGTGSISLAGGTVAALISVTTDTPQLGEFIGDPDYLTSRGYVTASNSLGSVYEFNRLVFGTQVRQLPRFTSLISWSFPPNLVVSITELFVR